jgi:nitroimidazol reductase NimA-like FMN-containing flavoprotein (pyridoxamine 5'-phosphate oxidase superfamily)
MFGELDEPQIDALLLSQVVGRIGCHGDGRTYVVPVTYVYAGGAILGHAHEGLKVRIMRQNPDVCFEVDRMENMANWQSAIVWGAYQELEGEEASQAMEVFLRRLLPFVISETALPHQASTPPPTGAAVDVSARRGIVYRINITKKTGRFEKR